MTSLHTALLLHTVVMDKIKIPLGLNAMFI